MMHSEYHRGACH